MFVVAITANFYLAFIWHTDLFVLFLSDIFQYLN